MAAVVDLWRCGFGDLSWPGNVSEIGRNGVCLDAHRDADGYLQDDKRGADGFLQDDKRGVFLDVLRYKKMTTDE